MVTQHQNVDSATSVSITNEDTQATEHGIEIANKDNQKQCLHLHHLLKLPRLLQMRQPSTNTDGFSRTKLIQY